MRRHAWPIVREALKEAAPHPNKVARLLKQPVAPQDPLHKEWTRMLVNSRIHRKWLLQGQLEALATPLVEPVDRLLVATLHKVGKILIRLWNP